MCSDQEPMVVNLDSIPVEAPEQVARVNPLHPPHPPQAQSEG
ncbi:MAG TPA: hypothetical protein VFX31_00395 [Ktedonobacterales bacterium]|nr:hypothetical protein [Ktedonobacterales bacterium]HEX5569811.1 hypothetical protein [Ktedonobacterales bacterium]